MLLRSLCSCYCLVSFLGAQHVVGFTISRQKTTSHLSSLFVTTDPTTVPVLTSTDPSDGRVSQPIQQSSMDEPIFHFNKRLIDTVYDLLCWVYPVEGTQRDYARFYVLETVARVPYFAYLSVLHLRETMGDRGSHTLMRTHYAQADNEYHHLLIMEHLGGNAQWFDRMAAQTIAFVYYWYVVAVYVWKKPVAYHLSELIEDHAYDTYDGFLQQNEGRLKDLPVPEIARKYYEQEDPYFFDLFCTVKEKGAEGVVARRPKLATLYDVFVNIRDDEREHWKTLCNLVQYNDVNAVSASEVRATKPAGKT